MARNVIVDVKRVFVGNWEISAEFAARLEMISLNFFSLPFHLSSTCRIKVVPDGVKSSTRWLERGPGFLTVIRDFYRSKAGQDCDTESGVVVFNNPWRRDELNPPPLSRSYRYLLNSSEGLSRTRIMTG